MAKLSDVTIPSLLFEETADASISTPAAGKVRLFVDDDGLFKWKNEAGVVTEIGGGGGGTPEDGWVDDTATTWTYASATTFTVAGDLTATFTPGTRLKLTQTTVKYFVVVSSSHGGGTTTVTITAGSSYTFANAAVTANYYSYAANPQGWPTWFTYSCAPTGFSGTPTQTVSRFSVFGRQVTVVISVTGTSNATTMTWALPIAAARAIVTFQYVVDAGTSNTVGRADTAAASTTVTMYRNVALAAFTNSGTKAMDVVLTYEIA